MKKKLIEKKFGVDFDSSGGALTLNPSEVSDKDDYGLCERKHKDGWKIKGEIQEDYCTWVNDFEAKHPRYGKVWGNFEDIVYATSEKGYQHFYKHHTPQAWDYQDI